MALGGAVLMGRRNALHAAVPCKDCGAPGIVAGGRELGICGACLKARGDEITARKEAHKGCTHPNAEADKLNLGKPDRYCPDCWEWALDGVFASERIGAENS